MSILLFLSTLMYVNIDVEKRCMWAINKGQMYVELNDEHVELEAD